MENDQFCRCAHGPQAVRILLIVGRFRSIVGPVRGIGRPVCGKPRAYIWWTRGFLQTFDIRRSL